MYFIILNLAKIANNLGMINSQIEGVLSNIDLSVAINSNPNIYIDLSLIGEPIIQNKMVELSFNSTVFSIDQKSLPVRDIAIPHVTQSTKQIQFYLSENVINSMLIPLKDIGYFNFKITPELTEKYFKLDTTNLGWILPNLTQVYGKDQRVNFDCKTTDYPKATLSTDNIDSGLKESIILNVELTNGTIAAALEFEIETSFSFKVLLDKGLAKGEIKNFNINKLKVTKSNIGDINEGTLQFAMNFAISSGLISLNEILKAGYTLPSFLGLVFSDANLNTKEGFLAVEMNTAFVPQIKRFLNKY